MTRLLLVPLFVLAACAANDPANASDDTCGAANHEHLIGQEMSVLEGMTFPDSTRIIAPNSAITMDLQPTRLNFDLDEEGVIQKVWCG